MKTFLNETQLAKLSHTIGEMEKSTSGEIRLMIVRRSSAIGHVDDLLWLILLVLSFLTIWFFRHDMILFERWWMLPALFAGLFAVARLLARTAFIQRVLTSGADLQQQVWARAEVEFSREIKGRTRSSTGILLYLSLMERRAVVLADAGIASKLPPDTWDGVTSVILAGAKTGQWTEKLEESIRLCGGYLAQHFPQEARDTNELSNAVIVKE